MYNEDLYITVLVGFHALSNRNVQLIQTWYYSIHNFPLASIWKRNKRNA